MKGALDPYLDEPLNTADHEYAARISNECRNQGGEAGTVDILIGSRPCVEFGKCSPAMAA